jgi:hypothetical protein
MVVSCGAADRIVVMYDGLSHIGLSLRLTFLRRVSWERERIDWVLRRLFLFAVRVDRWGHTDGSSDSDASEL